LVTPLKSFIGPDQGANPIDIFDIIYSNIGIIYANIGVNYAKKVLQGCMQVFNFKNLCLSFMKIGK
jgi:hypothetical protein